MTPTQPRRGGVRRATPPYVIARVLELAPLYLQRAIAEETGLSQPMVSNILVRHGHRRVTTYRAAA